jgi:hypothetical protein
MQRPNDHKKEYFVNNNTSSQRKSSTFYLRHLVCEKTFPQICKTRELFTKMPHILENTAGCSTQTVNDPTNNSLLEIIQKFSTLIQKSVLDDEHEEALNCSRSLARLYKQSYRHSTLRAFIKRLLFRKGVHVLSVTRTFKYWFQQKYKLQNNHSWAQFYRFKKAYHVNILKFLAPYCKNTLTFIQKTSFFRKENVTVIFLM